MSKSFVIVENMLAKTLGFKGKTVSVGPGGKQKVDAAEWARLYSSDKTVAFYYRNRSIEVTSENGSPWKPDGDQVDRERTLSREHLPPHSRTPSVDMGDEENDKKVKRLSESKPRPTDDIEPTPMAGVPGNANQAKASVIGQTSRKQLLAWGEKETRTSVLNAISKRLDDLTED